MSIEVECSTCGSVHVLDDALASRYAAGLIAHFSEPPLAARSQEVAAQVSSLLQQLPFERRDLFAAGGGKMLGCIVTQDDAGERRVHWAFSGMVAGRWRWPGWVEPCFDVQSWRALESRFDPQIAETSRRIHEATSGGSSSQALAVLRKERASLSRALMARYHDLYRLRGASGRTRTLKEIVGAEKMVSGMGDCCAPKLLNFAHREGLRVLSLAEFFVGVSRRPGQRRHGCFYAPCTQKCGPLMRHLVCPHDRNPSAPEL